MLSEVVVVCLLESVSLLDVKARFKHDIFKFRELRMFNIRIFLSVILAHMSVIYVNNISLFGLSVYF